MKVRGYLQFLVFIGTTILLLQCTGSGITGGESETKFDQRRYAELKRQHDSLMVLLKQSTGELNLRSGNKNGMIRSKLGQKTKAWSKRSLYETGVQELTSIFYLHSDSLKFTLCTRFIGGRGAHDFGRIRITTSKGGFETKFSSRKVVGEGTTHQTDIFWDMSNTNDILPELSAAVDEGSVIDYYSGDKKKHSEKLKSRDVNVLKKLHYHQILISQKTALEKEMIALEKERSASEGERK